jgi:hypothetical protein
LQLNQNLGVSLELEFLNNEKMDYNVY